MKPFRSAKLRWSEWLTVIRRESDTRSYPALAWAILKAKIRSPGKVSPKRYKRRIRQCHRCPVYDLLLRACRNSDGNGCGCYVPFLAKIPHPYPTPGCWIDQVLPNRDFGWAHLDHQHHRNSQPLDPDS